LVAEWLQLKGYLVELKIPATKGNVGGRTEPDVVGVRIVEDGKVEIVHAEVGNWPIGESGIARLVQKKFAPDIQKNIRKYFAEKLNFKGNVENITYKKMLVATWLSNRRKKQIQEIEKRDPSLKYYHLRELLLEQIPQALDEYKKSAVGQGRPGPPSTSLYLLYLLQESRKSFTGEKQNTKAFKKLAETTSKSRRETLAPKT